MLQYLLFFMIFFLPDILGIFGHIILICMVVLISSSTECDDSQRHKKKYVKASTAPILRQESTTRGLFFFHFTTMRMICRGCRHYGWSPRGHKIRGQNRPSLEDTQFYSKYMTLCHCCCQFLTQSQKTRDCCHSSGQRCFTVNGMSPHIEAS